MAVAGPAIGALTGTGRAPRSMLVLGDSWAAGLHADPRHALGQVAAARLGLAVTVDAVSGTGYVNGETAGSSYADRVRRLGGRVRADLVVVQGGSNDHAASAAALTAAATRTMAALRDRFPAAQRVMLGPGPDPVPVTAEQRAVDVVLHRVAATQQVRYISMLRQHWISERHPDGVLDPQNHHPTVAGQRYLGLRLAQALVHLHRT